METFGCDGTKNCDRKSHNNADIKYITTDDVADNKVGFFAACRYDGGNEFRKRCTDPEAEWDLYDVCSWGATLINRSTGEHHEVYANECGSYGSYVGSIVSMCGYTGSIKDLNL